MTALLADDFDPRRSLDAVVRLKTFTRQVGSAKRAAALSEVRVALHHGWDDGISPGEGRGSVPWHVPVGAEFDYEQARGYHASSARTFRPIEQPWAVYLWYHVFDRLTPDELRLADTPWDEIEEWDDLIPMRHPIRPVGGVFEDYADAFVPDERVEALIAEAEAMWDENGEARSGPTAKKTPDPDAERKREVARIKRENQRRRRLEQRERENEEARQRREANIATAKANGVWVEDVELPPVEDPELYGWPEPRPVEIQLREEIAPEPEPEVIPRSDYAAAMARVWGAPE